MFFHNRYTPVSLSIFHTHQESIETICLCAQTSVTWQKNVRQGGTKLPGVLRLDHQIRSSPKLVVAEVPKGLSPSDLWQAEHSSSSAECTAPSGPLLHLVPAVECNPTAIPWSAYLRSGLPLDRSKNNHGLKALSTGDLCCT